MAHRGWAFLLVLAFLAADRKVELMCNAVMVPVFVEVS